MELHCGDTILDLPVTDESYRLRSLMSDHNITFKFSSAEYIDVPVGAWVEFQGLIYTLKKPSNFKRQGLRIFEYTLILDSPQGDLALYKCRNTVDKRLKFTYTGKPSEHLQMIVDNMNRNSSGWTVGTCIDSVEVTISYNHNYCNEALKSLADKTKTEYEINNKEMSLRKVEYNKDAPLALSYGKGGGFKPGVGRENYNDSNPVGLLFVQGGERNINKSSYGSSELLLPKNQTIVYNNRTYVTDAEGYSVKNAVSTNTNEGSLDLSSIYPSRIGAVSSVVVVNESKNFYDIIDTSIPDTLNYNDYLIAGETMTIIFQSGMLAGDDKQFEVSYNHTTRKFEITPQEIDGMTMPGGSYIPKAGDQYAIFGIQLPDAYICDNVNKTGASWDMLREAVKYLYENEDQKFSFTGELDEVWSKKDWDNIGSKIKIGGYVHFSDANFQKDGIDIRIVNIKDYLNNPHAPVIELSNSVSGTSFSTEIGKIDQNEVVTQDSYKASLSFTKRRFRDAQETLKMLNSALLNFSGSISPVTINTMQLLVGDESLQFKFVDKKGADGNPAVVISDGIVYDNIAKTMSFTSKWLQHMSLGIKTMSSSHKPSEYKYWLINDFSRIMGTEEAAKSYYLYVVCSKTAETGHLILSESAIKMENDSDPDNYYLLTGILSSEYEGERSFVTVYGFTEILPGRITTDRIMSPDGLQFWSFVENAFVLDNGKSGSNHVRFSFNENGDGQLKLIGSITQVTPSGESVDINPSLYSFVYKKAASKPALPTGGTYLSPIPDGWSDGIPDGTDQLWESSRIFTINELAPQQSAWTEPRALTDTIDLQYMYSSIASSPSDPTATPTNWSSSPSTSTIWKAERIKKNNVWGTWNVYKIKGETGSPGAPGDAGYNGYTPENRYYKNGSRITCDNLPADVSEPSGWSKTMPEAGFLEYIWITSTIKTYDGSNFATSTHWSTPVCISPVAGGSPIGGLDWDATRSDYGGSPVKCTVVKYSGSYYMARADRPSIPAGTLPTDTNYWSYFSANFENLATQFAWIENAIISNFKYYNGAMASIPVDSNGKPNIILDGNNGYSKFSIIDLGNFHLDGNDIYGVDSNGIERIRLKATTIDDIATVIAGAWSIIAPSISQSEIVGIYQTNGYGSFSCAAVNEMNYNFTVADQTTIKINNSSFSYLVKSEDTSDLGHILFTGKTFLDGVEIATGNNIVVAAGTHTVTVRMTANNGTGLPNTTYKVTMVVQNLGVAAYSSSAMKTVIGTNGQYSCLGQNKYTYFSDSYGFEMRVGDWGIRFLVNGALQRYDGNRWCFMNSRKTYYMNSGSVTLDSSSSTMGVDDVLYNGSSDGSVYLPANPEDRREIKVRKFGSGNVNVYGNGHNLSTTSESGNYWVDYANEVQFVYSSQVSRWLVNKFGY